MVSINVQNLIVQGEVSIFLNNSDNTFYPSSQELPKTNCKYLPT